VHHGVDFSRDENIIRDIVLEEFEIGIPGQMSKVIRPAGDEIIHTDDFVPLG
jgi:hypothetical protein